RVMKSPNPEVAGLPVPVVSAGHLASNRLTVREFGTAYGKYGSREPGNTAGEALTGASRRSQNKTMETGCDGPWWSPFVAQLLGQAALPKHQPTFQARQPYQRTLRPGHLLDQRM